MINADDSIWTRENVFVIIRLERKICNAFELKFGTQVSLRKKKKNKKEAKQLNESRDLDFVTCVATCTRPNSDVVFSFFFAFKLKTSGNRMNVGNSIYYRNAIA